MKKKKNAISTAMNIKTLFSITFAPSEEAIVTDKTKFANKNIAKFKGLSKHLMKKLYIAASLLSGLILGSNKIIHETYFYVNKKDDFC